MLQITHVQIFVLFVLACSALSAADLTILPGTVELTGPEARQQLARRSSGRTITRKTGRAPRTGRSSNPKIATVDADRRGDARSPMAQPPSRRKAHGQSATATVRVKGAQAPFTWSFRNDVIPVLTKMGCNQGACHGALAGQERIQAHAARLRSGCGLRHADAAVRSAGACRSPSRRTA